MNSYVRDYVYQNNYKIIPSTMLKLSYILHNYQPLPIYSYIWQNNIECSCLPSPDISN